MVQENSLPTVYTDASLDMDLIDDYIQLVKCVYLFKTVLVQCIVPRNFEIRSEIYVTVQNVSLNRKQSHAHML